MVPSPDLLHSSSVHDEEASIYSTIRARKDQHSGDHKVVSSITACLLLNDLDIGILPNSVHIPSLQVSPSLI